MRKIGEIGTKRALKHAVTEKATQAFFQACLAGMSLLVTQARFRKNRSFSLPSTTSGSCLVLLSRGDSRPFLRRRLTSNCACATHAAVTIIGSLSSCFHFRFRFRFLFFLNKLKKVRPTRDSISTLKPSSLESFEACQGKKLQSVNGGG